MQDSFASCVNPIENDSHLLCRSCVAKCAQIDSGQTAVAPSGLPAEADGGAAVGTAVMHRAGAVSTVAEVSRNEGGMVYHAQVWVEKPAS